MDLDLGYLLDSPVELLKTSVAQTPYQTNLMRLYVGEAQEFIFLKAPHVILLSSQGGELLI